MEKAKNLVNKLMFKEMQHRQNKYDTVQKQKGEINNYILHKAMEIATTKTKINQIPIEEKNAENEESTDRVDTKSQKSRLRSQNSKLTTQKSRLISQKSKIISQKSKAGSILKQLSRKSTKNIALNNSTPHETKEVKIAEIKPNKPAKNHTVHKSVGRKHRRRERSNQKTEETPINKVQRENQLFERIKEFNYQNPFEDTNHQFYSKYNKNYHIENLTTI